MSFTNERELAAAFSAYKELERALKEDGELPAGFSEDLSGVEVRVKIPQGTRVYREIGKNGDGTILKKATQNLYGWTVWAFLLKKINGLNVVRGNRVKDLIRYAWKQAILNPSTRVEESLRDIDPELAEYVEDLKRIDGPLREEKTPRKIEHVNSRKGGKYNKPEHETDIKVA
jgi:hypothetical protein